MDTVVIIAIVVIVIISIVIAILYAYYSRVKFSIPQKSNHDRHTVPGKTVWLLWLQGWENAPLVCQYVRTSWEILNPDWNIELVSESTIQNFIDLPNYIKLNGLSNAAKSDIIRLYLLAEHGGVWADATLLCLHPLDNWIYDPLQTSGFWMYRGVNYGRGPASWFIISLKGTIIINKWREACDKYWESKEAAENYFWMDELFGQLCKNDPEFLSEWKNVPSLWCETRGQAHMLTNKYFDSNPDLQEILRRNPPYVLKLTWHTTLKKIPYNSNTQVAIDVALNQPNAPYPLHQMQYEKQDCPFSDFVIIAADCKHQESIKQLQTICQKENAQLVVYDKCNFCKHIPRNIYSRPLENTGREGMTYVWFAWFYYYMLPSRMIMIPTPINKHKNRMEYLQRFLADPNAKCSKLNENERNFTLDVYENKQMIPATIRPFGRWFDYYVGDYVEAEHKTPACWNGTVQTSREKILKNSRLYYWNLYQESKISNNSEAVHFIERSMGYIFDK